MSSEIIAKELEFSVGNIFKNKGTVASIAEKSAINCDAKRTSSPGKSGDDAGNSSLVNLYYFAVQHAFKQVDRQQVFKIEAETSKPTEYTALTYEHFKEIAPRLRDLIENMRNLNAHYMHTFDHIKESEILKDKRSAKIIPFLKESFRLAVVQSFINEAIGRATDESDQIGLALTKEQKSKIVAKCLADEKGIVDFLKTIFYQKLYAAPNGRNVSRQQNQNPKQDAKQKQEQDKISFIDGCWGASLEKAIDFILFVEAEKDFEWHLSKDGSASANGGGAIPIKAGKYLSFNAMLFLFSMFLYKNEANALIPKISGFKKNGTLEDQRKLNVFLFYAKKFGSQDINCEDKQLIYFRDIVQYLGKFPLAWSKALEGKETEALRKFKEAIYRQEINRQFPAFDNSNNADSEDFKRFALDYLFRKGAETKNTLWSDIITKDRKIIDVYMDIKKDKLYAKSYRNPKHYDYYVLKHLVDRYYKEKSNLVRLEAIDRQGAHKKKFNDPKNFTKLTNRIAHNLVIQSHARNRDRFLELGIRYLADVDYFGAEAQFKMYKYYRTLEQQEAHEKLDKKAKDKLKFKNGKEVEYRTYAESRKRYGEWDMPFVVENNAVFAKLQGEERPIAIHRDLMVCFLEDALYFSPKQQKESGQQQAERQASEASVQGEAKNRGLEILKSYFEALDGEKAAAIDVLIHQDTIDRETKSGFKKILPRRLLNRYLAAQQDEKNGYNKENSLRRILQQAEAQEERYEGLRAKAAALDAIQAANPMKNNTEKSREALFYDKNKGKNFKLTFIRKACNIMYFRDIYRQKSGQNGHHKQLHITQDEYNDFCKWMYAFDTVPYYKTRLTALFDSKGFFKNDEFREIIEASATLSDIYEKVKQKYSAWLALNESTVKKGKYDLASYDRLLNSGVRYINIWHFRQFAANKYWGRKNGKFVYRSLTNKKQLVSEYYAEKPTEKAQRKLWNSLKKSLHEDCLLYEMAIYYFNTDKTIKEREQKIRVHVKEILKAEFDLPQACKDAASYAVSVPIKNIDKWIELKKYSKTKNILKGLPIYLAINGGAKELKGIAKVFNDNKKIALSDFSKVNNHIINSQAKFTCCVMALEKFYIQNENLPIPEDGWLDIPAIPELRDYPDLKKPRNAAFHYDLLKNKTYQTVFTEIEKCFAQKEICKDLTIATLSPTHEEVLEVFLKKMRGDVFDKSIYYQADPYSRGKKADNKEIQKKALEEYLKEMQKKAAD
jgi:hypothetical protein